MDKNIIYPTGQFGLRQDAKEGNGYVVFLDPHTFIFKDSVSQLQSVHFNETDNTIILETTPTRIVIRCPEEITVSMVKSLPLLYVIFHYWLDDTTGILAYNHRDDQASYLDRDLKLDETGQ